MPCESIRHRNDAIFLHVQLQNHITNLAFFRIQKRDFSITIAQSHLRIIIIIIIFIYTAQIQRTFSNAPYSSKSFTILKSNLQFFHQIKSNQMLVFEERGKPAYPEKNLSEQSREPTNSAHI